jgi:hypothetical protein
VVVLGPFTKRKTPAERPRVQKTVLEMGFAVNAPVEKSRE